MAVPDLEIVAIKQSNVLLCDSVASPSAYEDHTATKNPERGSTGYKSISRELQSGQKLQTE